MIEQPYSRILKIAAHCLPVILAACGGFDLGRFAPTAANPTATLDPQLTVVTDEGPTPTGAPGIETPTLMCTPPACAPGEGYACPTGDCPGGCGTICVAPTPITGPLAPAPTDWENLEGWLTMLWQGGVDPAAVRAALRVSGIQKSLDDWQGADLDGDLRDEWILTLYDQSMPGAPFGAAGDLWIVNDRVAFRYYIAPSSDIFEFLAPTIVDLADMTGDGLPELIADAPTCGAHTCFNNYRIIGLWEGQFTDLQFSGQPNPQVVVPGKPTPIAMSYANARLEDVDSDGLPEFLVHGGTIGSAGAGVVRARTEVWDWNGAAVILAGTILDPTAYRHHILYEANELMEAGDLDAALVLYEATINDGALRNDGFFHPPEQTYADISAFAAFRLILIDLLQGNAERANDRLAWLGATYPDSAVAGAAARLVGEWAGPENADPLCDRIEADLLARENPAGALADMGYGNPSLAAGDFCPSMHADQ
jgi:hypothetical protein